MEARAGEATLRPCSCGHGMWGKGVGLGHGAHSVLAARSQGENQGVCRRSGRLVRPCSPYPTLTGANALQGVPRSPSAFDDRWAGRDERCAVKRMFIGLSNPSISATGTFPPTFPGFSLSTAIPRQLPIYPCIFRGRRRSEIDPERSLVLATRGHRTSAKADHAMSATTSPGCRLRHFDNAVLTRGPYSTFATPYGCR